MHVWLPRFFDVLNLPNINFKNVHIKNGREKNSKKKKKISREQFCVTYSMSFVFFLIKINNYISFINLIKYIIITNYIGHHVTWKLWINLVLCVHIIRTYYNVYCRQIIIIINVSISYFICTVISLNRLC